MHVGEANKKKIMKQRKNYMNKYIDDKKKKTMINHHDTAICYTKTFLTYLSDIMMINPWLTR